MNWELFMKLFTARCSLLITLFGLPLSTPAVTFAQIPGTGIANPLPPNNLPPKHPATEAQQQFQRGEQAFQTNRFPEARTAYLEALRLWEQSDRIDKQANALFKLAQTNEVLGEYHEALLHYQKALTLFTQLNRTDEQAGALSGTGIAYLRMGQYSNAIEAFQATLKLVPQSGVALNGLGLAYSYLGDGKTALDYYEKSLVVRRRNKLFLSAAATLINMGIVHESQGETRRALNLYQQALEIFKSNQYPPGWITSLNEIGKLYTLLNDPDRAQSNFKMALDLAVQSNYPRGQGYSLEYIGLSYHQRQEYPKAIESYHRSLSVRRAIGDREGEAVVLNRLGDTFRESQEIDLAILFYKQSVNVYEGIRSDLRKLPREQQSSYTKTVEKTYRNLADLLLKRDRILEAQQVLDLLKFQELEQYLNQINTVRSSRRPPENLLPEAKIITKYDALQTSAITLGKELAALRSTPEANRTEMQRQRIIVLTKLEEDLNQEFNQFRDRPEIQALLASLSPQVRKQTIDTADLDALRADLKQLNAVLIYPLVLDDRLELIITTPDSPPLRRPVNVKRETLNLAIKDFRNAITTQAANPEIYAQQLYRWLIEPIEADLQASNPKTLIYAPDAQLRYIPLGALHDGKQWLTERYAINAITAKSLLKFTREPQKELKILAGAIGGKATQVKVGARSFDFKGLPFTTTEVQSIRALQPTSTEPLTDDRFTLDNLKPKLGDYNVLHLATHAALVPGNPENSFILFSGNTTATLKDIENWTLNNFDLVVLSACETGLGGNFGSNGEEILGLGYQFQNRGAKATIASLWQVDDGGTQQLMTAFYQALQQGQSKSQALRSAQMALLGKRDSSLPPLQPRSDLEPHYVGTQKLPTVQQLGHPYYWAPFILIGNGL